MTVFLALTMLVALGACSASVGGGATSTDIIAPAAADRTESPYQPESVNDGSFGYATERMEAESVPMPSESAPMQAVTPNSSPSASASGNSSSQAAVSDSGQNAVQMEKPNNVQDGRKITFWASLTIDTKSFDSDYQTIKSMVDQSGGYIASESMRDNSTPEYLRGRITTLTIKIPATGYNPFVESLSQIGTVTSRNQWSDDLTTQYFDTAARIEMLEIRKERLMNYLLEAETAADIVAFERELSSVLYELDAYQSNFRQLNQLVDYSTVDITLNELITPETIGPDGEPLGDRASDAFLLSASGVGRFLENAVVFLASAAPVLGLLIVIAAIAWVIWLVVRKSRARFKNSESGKARQKRKEEKAVQKYEKTLKQTRLYQIAQENVYQQTQPVPVQPVEPEVLSPSEIAVEEDYPAPVGPPIEREDAPVEPPEGDKEE